MKTVITPSALRSFAYLNDRVLSGKPRGLVLDFMGLGGMTMYGEDSPRGVKFGREGVLCIPHLGASTPESEENCARMAAAEIRDYLENGSIRHSVNFPELQLGAPEAFRLLVLHENIPNTISSISSVVAQEGINIENLVNKSKKDMAATVMEMQTVPSQKALEAIGKIPGVVRVRLFQA